MDTYQMTGCTPTPAWPARLILSCHGGCLSLAPPALIRSRADLIFPSFDDLYKIFSIGDLSRYGCARTIPADFRDASLLSLQNANKEVF
jgi:hypothetical protein